MIVISLRRRNSQHASSLGSAFVNTTPDAIFMLRNGIIVDCNDATMQVYGHAKDAIIGKGPEFFSPEYQPCGTPSSDLATKHISEALEKGYSRFTWTNRHSSGKNLPLLVTLGVAEVDAEKLIVVTAQDYTEVDTVVRELSASLTSLAGGDLSHRIVNEFPVEYEGIRHDLNNASNAMLQVIEAIFQTTTTIRTGSEEIAQASEDLARRTESNAAALEETVASVQQMDGRLRASATAATRTVERADQAIATVVGGRSVTDDAVQAMGRVSESAEGIDSVIEGLDKIAFQTRVLAMNAAVEAGRAGDAGRGFAVVADLVSALAMRAEEEAKRARDQLTVTRTEIITAVDAVTKVDGALADIFGDVNQVHELLATMAADNRAQSAAITEISTAIGTMDKSTQQNAAMVEETSAAARNLAGEVNKLADQARRFSVSKNMSKSSIVRRPAQKMHDRHLMLN